MALWEYKVITSGKGGFATPQLLENFLNQLGKEEWEIVEFRSAPENFLAFTGLARRGVQRDWTLEAGAAAAAQAGQGERKARERAAAMAREREGPAPEPTAPPQEADGGARDESFRRPRDTELDQDPEALAEEAGAVEVGDWDDLPDEDELPTLFEAIRPHLRRNQKGPGQSVAIDYLAKRWEQEPDDIVGALLECGFTIPETEDSAPDYFEFEGDLYWLNKNNRGQLFLNVREKPRPAFRVTPVRKLDPSDPAAAELAAEHQAEVDRRNEQKRQQEQREAERQAKAEAAKAAREAAREAKAAEAAAGQAAAASGELPEGEALLTSLRPRMRQNRRGGGFSGSTSYLAKALRRPEEELVAALTALGLVVPEQANGKADPVEIGPFVYWINKDNRGGLWINGREKREGEDEAAPSGTEEASGERSAEASAEAAAAGGDTPEPDDETGAGAEDTVEPVEITDALPATELPPDANPLEVLRTLLKANRRGSGASAPVEQLARAVNRPVIELMEALVRAGLPIPDDSKEKPVTVEIGDEALWLSRSTKDESLWLNAKSKSAGRRRTSTRGRRKSEADATEASGPTETAPAASEASSEAPAETTSTETATAESAPAEGAASAEPASSAEPQATEARPGEPVRPDEPVSTDDKPAQS